MSSLSILSLSLAAWDAFPPFIGPVVALFVTRRNNKILFGGVCAFFARRFSCSTCSALAVAVLALWPVERMLYLAMRLP